MFAKVNIILILNDYKITKLQALNYIDVILRIWIGLTEQSRLIVYPISCFYYPLVNVSRSSI